MTRYFLVSFSLDAMDTLEKSGPRAGMALSTALEEGLYTGTVKAFPGLVDMFGKAVSHPDPLPVPVFVDDKEIGTVLGHYYDDIAVGTDTKPAMVPSQSIVCVISDTHIGRVFALNGSYIAKAIDEFMRHPDRQLTTTIKPVFVNDTDGPFPLHIVKTSPFTEKDVPHIDRMDDGSAWNMKAGYKSPRTASLING